MHTTTDQEVTLSTTTTAVTLLRCGWADYTGCSRPPVEIVDTVAAGEIPACSSHRHDGSKVRDLSPAEVYGTVDVPFRFFEDHESRALFHGSVVKHLSRTVRIAAEPDVLEELLSDARHYSSPVIAAELGRDYAGLVASARKTVEVLEVR